MACKETPAALCSFSLDSVPPKSLQLQEMSRVVLDVGVAWKGEGKAWAEVLGPWGGRESPGMQGGIGSHELLV